MVSSVGTRGAGAVAGTRGFVFLFSTGRRNVHEQGKGVGTMGIYFAVGLWFFLRAITNSIGQYGARLIASRFGFGAQKGTNCGMEQ